jgi:hypothetical protein
VRNRALVQDDATDVASVPQPPPLAAVAGEPLRSQRELTKHGDAQGGKAAGGTAHGLMIEQTQSGGAFCRRKRRFSP